MFRNSQLENPNHGNSFKFCILLEKHKSDRKALRMRASPSPITIVNCKLPIATCVYNQIHRAPITIAVLGLPES